MGEKPEQNEYGVAFSQLHAPRARRHGPRRRAGHRHRQAVLGARGTRSGLARTGRAVLVPNRARKAARRGSFRIASTRTPAWARRWWPAISTATSGPISSSATRRARLFSFTRRRKSIRRTWEAAQPNADEAAAAADPRRQSRAPAQTERRLSRDGGGRARAESGFREGRSVRLDGRRATAFEDQPIEGDTVQPRRSRQRQRPSRASIGSAPTSATATGRRARSRRCRSR